MSYKMTAEELLERYAAGERDFAGVDLHGVDLSNAVLRGINLDRADLSGVNFSNTDLSGAYGKNLSRRLNEETLKNTTYPGKYSSSGLGKPLGSYTCIRYAVLCNANFRDADIGHVDFSRSNLSFANFIQVDSDRVIFDYACLFCAVLEEGMRIGRFEGANVEGTILENAEWV